MKALVIGGTGHIGGFLVPQLVDLGCEVTVVTRGRKAPQRGRAWSGVRLVEGTYKRGDEAWGALVADQAAEVVIDILGSDVPATYRAARKHCRHYVACGSLWMYGHVGRVPTPEQTQSPCPFEWYAMRYEELLATMKTARAEGVAFTAVMPPNIAGPGKIPIDCRGGRDLAVHKAHSRGEPVVLPEGCQTLIGPCDASDVARGFSLAAGARDKAAGEIFNVGSAYALTAPRLVEAYGEIYGVTIPIRHVPHDEFFNEVLPEAGANFHFRSHMAPDISKIGRAFGYRPEFTPEQALARGVDWMRNENLL
jgi:nucleoside-diphosphate-sugar epimerase